MTERDHYRTLGVDRDAPVEKIKEAYRRLALRFHPDRDKSDRTGRRFKEISEAYAVLSDSEKRREYDAQLLGEDERDYVYETKDTEKDFQASSFQDIFGDARFRIFDAFNEVLPNNRDGYERRPAWQPRGEDVVCHVEVNLEDISSDTTKEIEVKRREVCPACGGRASSGRYLQPCEACEGAGEQTQFVRKTGFGRLSTIVTCKACGGLGYVRISSCQKCGGNGVVERVRRIQVVIPAGVEDGHTLRMVGEGEAGKRGGPPGNLYLVVNVMPHPTFRRKGSDLYLRTRISSAEADSGTKLMVPTLGGGGTVVTIQPSFRSETILRLSGMGLPIPRSTGRGNLYVQVAVTPKNKRKRRTRTRNSARR